MCHPAKCKNCGKTTWSGCGQHVAAVKASVPKGEWCTCSTHAPAGPLDSLKKLFGR